MVYIATASAALLAIAASTVRAQQAPTSHANATQIALVEAQYNASGFADADSFDITLKATALLSVVYGDTVVENGAAYSADEVSTAPTIYVQPAAGTNITTDDKFTLMLADASALGNIDAEGNYRHYLANDVHAPSNWTSEQDAFHVINDTVITYYAGPGPLVGTGAHRYAWLLFQQPDNFKAPANLSTSGVSPSHWSVEEYVEESGLGNLIAASFFTVENGAPTVSAVATSSIDIATLAVATTSSGAATSGSSTASGAAAAGAAQTSSSSSAQGAAPSSFSVPKSAGTLAVVLVGAALLL